MCSRIRWTISLNKWGGGNKYIIMCSVISQDCRGLGDEFSGFYLSGMCSPSHEQVHLPSLCNLRQSSRFHSLQGSILPIFLSELSLASCYLSIAAFSRQAPRTHHYIGRNEAVSHVLACDCLGVTYQLQWWLLGLLGICYTEYHAVWWQFHFFFSNPYASIFCAKLNWLRIQVQRWDWAVRQMSLLALCLGEHAVHFSPPVMSLGWLPLRL